MANKRKRKKGKKSHARVSGGRRRKGGKRRGRSCPEICPKIHVSCHQETGTKKVKDWSVAREEYVTKHVPLPPHKVCVVKLGNRVRAKNIDSTKAGAVIAKLRKGLLGKNCQALVVRGAGA